MPLREYNLIGGILARSVVRIAPPPPSPRRPDRLLLLQIPPPTAHQQRIAFSSRSVGRSSLAQFKLSGVAIFYYNRPGSFGHSSAASFCGYEGLIGQIQLGRTVTRINRFQSFLEQLASRYNDLILGRTSSTSPITPFGKLISPNTEQGSGTVCAFCDGSRWGLTAVQWSFASPPPFKDLPLMKVK